ncbi:hypothetical protein EMO92_04820 [Bifidobacterium reuteri]|uniref:Fibronectin type III-like domain-containing protein n=1 Tax=Bifidobacterium reuteri TaxID=983706 RepID=A0A5J5E9N1_9BIFI|nr:glycoside hydrolase family 3 C-terminal domain-containing protein [Bifidobacterium reuteri]KAA8825786.1 hypothetical protein EMO92_04820 [Bifidobacterium reuteri]
MVSPFRRRRSKPREPHTIRHSIALTLSTLIAVILVAATVITFHLGVIIDGLLFAPSSIVTDEQKSAIQTKATDLSHQIESEGAVLLRNEDNTLPLSADIKKVNVFGWASTAWMAGGSGSGTVSDWTGNADGIIEALNQAGIKTNAKLTSMYKDFQDGREYTATLRSLPEQSARLYEPSIDDKNYYSDTLLADAEAYSDTAFVVIGRLGGESNDMPRQQYKRTTKGGDIVVDDTRTSLDLSTEEELLLTYVGEHYDHVVVILNTGNVMTLGQLETIPGIDACLHAGLTGTSAASAIPDLLWGKTNPSGRTVDTWAYSLDTAASWANSGLEGVGSYTNADGLYPIGVSNGNLGVEATYDQVSYVDYAEGIYVGYKWYETADAEGYWKDVASEHGNGYEGVVQYPFGYGLSYTSFDWEVVQAPSGSFNGDDTLSMIVKVTNTGDMAGKDVVELYYGAPYTPGGIEKSAVNLAALAKTDELRPGQSQEVTLRFDARDMASYDCYDANGNGFAGYELDPGDYTLTLRHNAHTLDDAAGATVTMSLDFGVQYTEDSVSGNTVGNKFTGSSAVDGVSVDGADSGQDIAYTTRADFKGTFSKNNVPERTLGDNAKKLNLYEPEAADIASADGSSDTIVTGAKNGLKLEEN